MSCIAEVLTDSMYSISSINLRTLRRRRTTNSTQRRLAPRRTSQVGTGESRCTTTATRRSPTTAAPREARTYPTRRAASKTSASEPAKLLSPLCFLSLLATPAIKSCVYDFCFRTAFGVLALPLPALFNTSFYFPPFQSALELCLLGKRIPRLSLPQSTPPPSLKCSVATVPCSASCKMSS